MSKFYKTTCIIFWIILPSFFYLTIFISQELCLYSQQAFLLEAQINRYQRLGWDLDNVNSAFEESIGSKTLGDNQLFNYLLDQKMHNNNIQSIKEKLHLQIDTQKDSYFYQISELNQQSSIFYQDDIAVNTENYKSILKSAYFYLETENATRVEDRIFALNAQIIQLAEDQNLVIEEKIKELINSTRAIEFIGSEIGLNLTTEQANAVTITDSERDNIEKYSALKTLRSEMINSLNAQFINRGGKESSKRILIDISEQQLYMIEEYQIIYDMPASTGIVGHETRAGEFQVYDKIDMAWGYYDIWMPYWLTIYYAGSSANGIHGIPLSPDGTRWSSWDQVVGVHPITYGCVMPHDWDAEKIYNWADIGTPVTIVY